MIKIFRLMERIVDPSLNSNVTARQIKLHVLKVGHGLGSIDFNQCVMEMTDEEYDLIVQGCGDYGRFKLGNLNSYFEVDIFPEHAEKLSGEMPPSALADLIKDLQEGYIVLKKIDDLSECAQ